MCAFCTKVQTAFKDAVSKLWNRNEIKRPNATLRSVTPMHYGNFASKPPSRVHERPHKRLSV
jgi:hypothetical protein